MLAVIGAANPTSERHFQCSVARSYSSTRASTLSCALMVSLRASVSLGKHLQGTRCRIVHKSGTKMFTSQGFGMQNDDRSLECSVDLPTARSSEDATSKPGLWDFCSRALYLALYWTAQIRMIQTDALSRRTMQTRGGPRQTECGAPSVRASPSDPPPAANVGYLHLPFVPRESGCAEHCRRERKTHTETRLGLTS